jgi:ATP-dependent Clp protease ATP-binding subunit ClpA
MFERFTEKAIKVIMLAQEEARRLGHNFVGTEQILLGLIGEGTGIAAKVLKSMGISLKDARLEVEKIIGRGSGFVAVEIPFTPRAKRVLELSLEEARQLGIIFTYPQIQLFHSCLFCLISYSRIITLCASSTPLDAPLVCNQIRLFTLPCFLFILFDK